MPSGIFEGLVIWSRWTRNVLATADPRGWPLKVEFSLLLRSCARVLACRRRDVPTSAMPNSSASTAPASRPGFVRRLGAAGPFALMLTFCPPLGALVLLSTLTSFGPWLRDHGAVGMLFFFLVIGLLLGVSFVPTYTSAILAGWAFGFWVGWPLALATLTAASLLARVLGTWVARDRVMAIIREKPSLFAVHQALLGAPTGKTALVVTLLRVSPMSPFALTNFAFSAAQVPLGAYLFGTVVGLAPRTALAAYAAAGVEQLMFKQVGDRTTVIVGIAVTVVAFGIVGLLAKRALRGLTAPPKSR